MLVGIKSNKLGPTIGRADGIFSQHAADLIRFIVSRPADGLPDLLLPGLVGRNREGHELLKGHAVFGIDLVQLRRHGRQPQSLLHDGRRHEVPGRDLLLGQAGAEQGLKGSELIERMEPDPLVILGKRIVFGDTALAHDAGNGLRLGHAFLLHEKFQRAIAPAAGRNLEQAGFVAFCIDDGPDIQALR